MPCKRTTGLTCRRVIVALACIVVIGAVVGYLVVWVEGLPGPHHGAYLAFGSLHNIREGFRDYDEAHGHLPPTTTTDAKSGERSSWRIEVYQSHVHLGFITAPKTNGNDSIDYDRHKAWNDPDNLRLQGLGAWLFRYTQVDACPPGQSMGKASIYTTYYKAITGPSTAFDSAKPPSLKELPNALILVARVEHSDTHWMEPGDLSIEQLAPPEETKRLLLGKDGYVVLFADGEGWVLSGKTPILDLCKFFTIEGAKQSDREQILGPYRVLP